MKKLIIIFVAIALTLCLYSQVAYANAESEAPVNPEFIKPPKQIIRIIDYVVKPGDTLRSIAKAHHTTWRILYKLNRTKLKGNPNLIRVKWHLKVESRVYGCRPSPINI